MTEWIRLDRSKLAPLSVQEEIDGVTVSVTLSPHDIPIAVRGKREDDHFVIEFKYLDEERTRATYKDDGVVVYTGRYSDRIYALWVPRSLVEDCNTISLKIQTAIDSLGYQGISSNRAEAAKGNHRIAKEAVALNSDRLFTTQK